MSNVKYILVGLFPMSIILGTLNSCFHKPEKDAGKEIAKRQGEQKIDNRASEKDAQFLVDIVESNMAELKIAELGEQQAKAIEVKEIATMLKAEQTEILSKFKLYASLRQIDVPVALTPEAEEAKDEILDELDDRDFDKEWCEDVKKIQEKAIEKVERAASEATDPELKDLANETLPVVRLHYNKITACANKFK